MQATVMYEQSTQCFVCGNRMKIFNVIEQYQIIVRFTFIPSDN